MQLKQKQNKNTFNNLLIIIVIVANLFALYQLYK